MNESSRTAHGIAWMAATAFTMNLLAGGIAVADTVEVCADAAERVFDDVADDGVHRANVDCVAAYGVTVGVGGGNYDPSGYVLRGQMASFLVNFAEVAADLQYDVPGASAFGDIAGTTHEDNIEVAAELGITSGVSASSYAPARAVTRGQMASFVVQTLESVGTTFEDDAADAFSDDDGSVHEHNIDRLAAAGIVAGVDGDRYDLNGMVTREQMATFLANAAGYLHDHELWNAGPLPVEAPSVDAVFRADETAADLIEVVWLQPVSLIGDVADFEVFGSANMESVARAAAITTSDDDSFTIRLDANLDAGHTYWLHVSSDAVRDASLKPNQADEVAFVFALESEGGSGGDGGGGDGGSGSAAVPTITAAAVNGDAIADGASVTITDTTPTLTGTASASDGIVTTVRYRVGGGGWLSADAVDATYDSGSEEFTATLAALPDGPQEIEVQALGDTSGSSELFNIELLVGASAPAIDSIVTDPTNARLVVTFTEPVTCPDTANARSAWVFSNHSVVEDGVQADGLPDSVTQSSESTSTCYLKYDVGIEAGDYGMLDYTDQGAGHQVIDSTDTVLATTTNVDVVDGVAPTFETLSAIGANSTLTLTFSEPIACASLGTSDFTVQYGIAVQTVSTTGCAGSANSTIELGMAASPPAGTDITVTIEVGDVVTDDSGNKVETPASQTATAA